MYLRAVSVHPRTSALVFVMGRYRLVPRESPDGSNLNPRICLNGQSVGCFVKRCRVYATITQPERLFLGPANNLCAATTNDRYPATRVAGTGRSSAFDCAPRAAA
jgi:hypothetical protein